MRCSLLLDVPPIAPLQALFPLLTPSPGWGSSVFFHLPSLPSFLWLHPVAPTSLLKNWPLSPQHLSFQPHTACLPTMFLISHFLFSLSPLCFSCVSFLHLAVASCSRTAVPHSSHLANLLPSYLSLSWVLHVPPTLSDSVMFPENQSLPTPFPFCLHAHVFLAFWDCLILEGGTDRLSQNVGRLRLKCDGTRAETRVRLSAKRTSPFKSAGASVLSTTGSRGVRISCSNGSNAGFTMFRGSVKSTGYPLHSLVPPSLPLPCVTVSHHISNGL